VLFRLLTVVLAVLLVAESVYILMHRHPANRFKPVEGYDAIVAFDTATGQLCKTLRTKSAAEIEKSAAEAAKQPVPCPPLPAPSGDPVLDEINRLTISKECGGSGKGVAQQSDDESLKTIVMLPAWKDIR
jgi:hypothetical protein